MTILITTIKYINTATWKYVSQLLPVSSVCFVSDAAYVTGSLGQGLSTSCVFYNTKRSVRSYYLYLKFSYHHCLVLRDSKHSTLVPDIDLLSLLRKLMTIL